MLSSWLSKVKAMQVREQRKFESGSMGKQSQSNKVWLSERYVWLGELSRLWTYRGRFFFEGFIGGDCNIGYNYNKYSKENV